MATQVATKEDAPLAVSDAELHQFAGQGAEFSTDDLAIPFLNVLQDNSPQIKKREGKYVEGAEAGMLFNTVSNELFDGEEGVEVIPCAYQRNLVEWVPREQEGGFVASHDPESGILQQAIKNERGQDVLPNGNYLANTANHYILLLSPTYGLTQAVLSMTSTQLKKSRRWNTQMVSRTLTVGDEVKPYPSFAFAYRLRTMSESNAKGSWFGYDISGQRPVIRSELTMGAAFHTAVMSGTVKARPQEEATTTTTDDVPF
jgi:hypothetical protein